MTDPQIKIQTHNAHKLFQLEIPHQVNIRNTLNWTPCNLIYKQTDRTNRQTNQIKRGGENENVMGKSRKIGELCIGLHGENERICGKKK